MADRRSGSLRGRIDMYDQHDDNENTYPDLCVADPIPVAKVLLFPAIDGNAIARDGNGMTIDHATGVRSILGADPLIAPCSDWGLLRDTILKSIATSPGAFLATADELKAESPEYWEERLKSSTWAVVQRGNEILGIAAAKPPSDTDRYALREKACFIESVWVDPSLRRKGVGERLVTYLIEQQRSARIHKFYLWVFDYNSPAIRLYDRMDFKRTGRASRLLRRFEIQFVRAFDSDVVDEDELKQNDADRERDQEAFGISYRLLTA